MSKIKKLVTFFLLALTIIVSGLTTNVSASENYKNPTKEDVVKSVNFNDIKGRTGYVYRNNSKTDKAELEQIKGLRVNSDSTKSSSTTSYVIDPGTGGGGANVGIAWPYTQNNRTDVNCYGYAGDFGFQANPGEIYGYSNCYGMPVSSIANYIIYDMQALGRSARIINQTDVIYGNEYRIAVRTGQGDFWDYHVMMQTSDVGWCDKPGTAPSRYLGQINPSTYNWDFKRNDGSVIHNFYNSPTIYLAVSKF